MIRFITNHGNIDIELDFDKAPATAQNFEQYAKDGFYNGTIFHRVIPGFMIQGGGMSPDMGEKAIRGPIENEAHNGLPNEKYTIAMARTSDPHSAVHSLVAEVFGELVDALEAAHNEAFEIQFIGAVDRKSVV